MAEITRVHGGVGEEGVLNGVAGTQLGANLKFFKIAVKNAANAAVSLVGEMGPGINGGIDLGVEQILRVVPSGILTYFVPNDATGVINIVVDGHAAFVPSTGSATQPGLQEIIRAMGTVVGKTPIDVSGTVVTAGTGFTVI